MFNHDVIKIRNIENDDDLVSLGVLLQVNEM